MKEFFTKEYITLAVFLLASLISFLAFGTDKFLAIKNRRRISEKTLLVTGILGGVGGVIAMGFFRHKTKKPKFYILMPILASLDIALLFYILFGGR